MSSQERALVPLSPPHEELISLRGARTHNLRGLDLDLPRGRFIVVTGPSGSGKSSLALDTLAREGQRRYLESLSSSARQRLGPIQRPPFDLLTGLPPTVAIAQDRTTWGPRETVGSVTEVLDHLRVLFARAGTLFCPTCGRPVERYSPHRILDLILAQPEGSRHALLAPVLRDSPLPLAPVLADMARQGFLRVRLDGVMHELAELIRAPAKGRHTLDVVIDRLVIRDGLRERLSDSLETALTVGQGVVVLAPQARDGTAATPELRFSTRQRCDHCELDLPEPTPRLLSFDSPEGACPVCSGLPTDPPCSACAGTRLRPEARAVRLAGHDLPSLCALSLDALRQTLADLPLGDTQRRIAEGLLAEVSGRLDFLIRVGLGGLPLSRPAPALSYGEASRVRLTASLGGALSGVLYVLDEPTRGLHPADVPALVRALTDLVAAGNTVITVEHDLGVIAAADLVVDLGPGAGRAGGELLAMAPPAELALHPRSVTGAWLAGHRRIPDAPKRPAPEQWLSIANVNIHNLRGVSTRIPLHRLSAIVGVSGAGKSSLVMGALEPSLRAALNRSTPPFPLSGHHGVDKVVAIDQAPIGRSPRSNPATFTKVFDDIRQLFAATRDAKARGFPASRFSFNTAGGRCEACQGDGQVKVELHFLPDVWVTCETCDGRRYDEPTLAVRYKGLDIADVLSLTVSELRPIFAPVTRIARVLDTLDAVGLGYLALGQPAQTLSGGEAQRLKLARELARPTAEHTAYLLDEPSAGLHPVDLERLADVLWRLVDRGHTVIVVDHRLALAQTADWLIELGPGGGERGGQVLYQGPPAGLAGLPTPTGRALSEVLARSA